MSADLRLTLRQLAGSRRLWLVLVLVSLPIIAAGLFHAADSTATSAEFADDITATLVASAILPLVILVLATSAFGNELADRTLGYLGLKPLPRWRIVVPKLLAALLVGGLPVAVSGLVSVALIEGGDVRGAVATGVGLLVGAAAYAAIFAWLGLASRHALIFGLIYVFVWEASLAAYLDGIRFLSVRGYTLALISGLDDERLRTIDLSLGAGTGAIAAVTVSWCSRRSASGSSCGWTFPSHRVRAVVYEAFGKLPTVETVADPTPAAHGAVVRIEASGLCRSDWHGWMGHDADIRRFPHVPGHELAGVVEAVGADVRRSRPGDRVTVPFVCACGTCPQCAAGTTRSATARCSRGSRTGARSPSSTRSTGRT